MKNTKLINFKAIGLSLIFLFNPNVNIIDPLPDFIGYIFLCLALVRLSDMNDTMSEAHSMFKKLILIDAGKLLAVLWVFGISVISERNSSLMLWSFAFGIIELIFVIPAFTKLFKGLYELGYLYENTSLIAARSNGKNKNRTDGIRRLTVVFVALKAVMSFLPELADLTSAEDGLINMYRYIGIMRFLALTPVFILGVIWLISVLIYFGRINKDATFISELEKLYDERVSNKKGIFVKRNVALSFGILLVALILSFDFRMESVNMFPDFVSGMLLTAFFIVAAKKTEFKKKLPVALGCIYVFVSLFAYASEFYFFKNYHYSAIDRNMDARYAFTAMSVSACVSSVMFLILCIFVLFTVRKIINQHTGVISVSAEYSSTSRKISEDIQKELSEVLIFGAVCAVIYSGADIAYVFLAKDYSFMFLISTVSAILFVCSFFKIYFDVSEAVNSKYILE